MQFNHRPPILSSALKTLTAAVASAVFLSSAAHAAGLGKLTVLSALGQPLRAEIELTAVSGDEASGLVAKLASPDAFRVANIEFNPALLSLRFAVEQRSGRQYIRISSSQPLNEPFVDMLLELSWNNGRLVREYTFLLDPAELRATQTAQAAAPAEAPAPRPRETAPVRTEARPVAEAAQPAPRARAQRPAAAEQPAPSDHASRAPAAIADYRVKRGDTLGRIASQLKPVDISLDMMLVALYRANPDAFIGNNMNRLKSGQILSVPDSDALRGTGQGEAHGVVVAHAADFNAYRNKLAGQVAASAPVRAPAASQSAGGKITAKVEERPTAANESQDQLRLSKAMPAPNANGKGVTASTEDAIAKEKALAEAQARVKELEKNVTDLEKLMTVKNRAGAEAADKARQAKAPAARPAPAAQPPAPAVLKPAQEKAPRKAAPAAPPEPNLVETLMDNINYIGAGLAVLLLAAFGVAQRRRQQPDARKAPEPSILGVPGEPAHALFAEAGGQSIDTSNSVFNSSFAPSASQLDTNEVDPVAEADVYIAYGRDAQAEEILKEALRTHPERHAVRLKLLEIYAARKDQRAFEAQAGDLYSATRGQGDEWAQAVALGLSIDPLNPLYAATQDAAAPQPTTEERGQQALLAQQLEQAFRKDEPAHGAGLDADEAPTALPQAGADGAATETPAAKAADEHSLDFDLGGLDFEPVSATAPIAMPGPAAESAQAEPTAVPDLEFDMDPFAPSAAPAAGAAPTASSPAAEEGFDLAFDMDFDKPASAQDAAAPQPGKADDELALDLSLGGPATDIDMANLAKEFDLPDLPAAPEDTAPASELKDPLFDLDAMNFQLPQAAAPSPAPAAGSPELKDPLFDLDAMNFDLPDTSAAPAAAAPQQDTALEDDPFAAPPEQPGAPEHSAIPRFDMAGIDLDLPPAEHAGDEPLPVPEAETTGAGAGDMSAAHMEMETKLDLAIAYQEIGDKEGARELLDEVIKG
ncbi:MAG: FimV/HubP family polar landmark protein, partial [Massilia sp.]